MISHSSIETFRALYRKQFGVDLTHEEAAEVAADFLNIARVVLAPMPKEFEPRYDELRKDTVDEESGTNSPREHA